VYAFNAATSSCHHASLLQRFQKLFSLRSHQLLFGNSLISCFGSITFRNIEIFHQNSIFVAETHVYTKPLTANHRLYQATHIRYPIK